MRLYDIVYLTETKMKFKFFFSLMLLQGYFHGNISMKEGDDDFFSDDDQKSWNKNSNLVDDIFKTIPFFKFPPSEYNEEENNFLYDPTQIEILKEPNQLKPKISIAITPSNAITPSKAYTTRNAISNRSVSSATLLSDILPSVLFSTFTSYQMKSSAENKKITVSSIQSFSSSFSFNNYSSASSGYSSMVNPSINILDFTMIKNETKILQKEKYHILESTSRVLKPTLAMEMTQLVASTPVANQSRFINTISYVGEISDKNIRLPDENGYGNSLDSKEKEKENKEKSFRYLYSYIIIPIMSGVIGALSVTFIILLYNCIKKRKLKKVRYYGAENVSDFYRVDQINLLSTSSSDED